MALQTTFKRFVSGCYEKLVVPGLFVASRKSHIAPSSNSYSPHNAKNFILPPLSSTGTETSNFMKEMNSYLITPAHRGQFFDLDFLNSVRKRIYMPSTSLNKVKVYEDKHYGILQTVSDPFLKDSEIIHFPAPGQLIIKKEANRMINIRRRKMKKHQRKKLYKKMKFVWEKLWRKREIRKETTFRLELLNQIDEAKQYDAEKYVQGVLDKIRYHKKPPSAKERNEQYRLLIKKNRGDTIFVMPKFDDD